MGWLWGDDEVDGEGSVVEIERIIITIRCQNNLTGDAMPWLLEDFRPA